MSTWKVDADTLVRSRFVLSPLAETTAALKALHRASAAHPGERAWLDRHLPAFRERLDADPITAQLVAAAFGRTWNADFLTPTPTGAADVAIEDELAVMRATPPAAAVADLSMSVVGPVPAALHRADLPERAADLLQWVWSHTVVPDWARRRRILEADVIARAALVSRSGWGPALDVLRPAMRWLGDGRLQINDQHYPDRDLTGALLFFVPVTIRYSWVSWDAHGRSAIVYPCSGVLVEADQPSPTALAALLGGRRAAVLARLRTPLSTSQLVELTGQALGSVGGHLKVLREAGLVERGRAGRSVLYRRTAAGDTLVAASGAVNGTACAGSRRR
jgi:DNA-binding transcriptional ArsR family regulator